MARLTLTGEEREERHREGKTRDFQVLPKEHQLHLECDFYEWRKEG